MSLHEEEIAAELRLRELREPDAAELRRIRREPEVWRWWDELEDDFPWQDEPEATRLAIELAGRVVGLIQYSEEPEPKYRHAEIDIFLDPAVRGRGIGPAAIRRLAERLIREGGHHRIVIGAALENTAAIRAYEKAGFQPVGVERQAERDSGAEGWHDCLLMDLVADDLNLTAATKESR